MIAENFTKSLRAFARRKPFRPFVVELVSGDSIFVEHPEALAFNNGAAVYLSTRSEWALFDHESVAQVRDRKEEENRESA